MPKKRIPSLNWLRVFEVAARTESFARAADELHMSASAVSQQVRALEGYLGKNLFMREPKRVRLTDSGRAFLPIVHQSLSSIETTAAALFGSDEREQVTLQTVYLLAMGWLPKQIAAFEAENPNVKINLVTAELLPQYNKELPGWDPDLQIAYGSASDFPEGAEPLFGETISVVAHPDVAAEIDGFSSAQSHRLYEIASHRVGWHQILSSHEEINLESLDITTVDSTPVALMMAAEGLGLALARSPASKGLVEALGLVECAGYPKVQGLQSYFLLTPPARRHGRGAGKLADWLRNAGKEI